MKNATEIMLPPDREFTDEVYIFIDQSKPTGIENRPYTGHERVSIRWNPRYGMYVIRGRKTNSVIDTIMKNFKPQYLDLFIHALIRFGFKKV